MSNRQMDLWTVALALFGIALVGLVGMALGNGGGDGLLALLANVLGAW